MIRRPTSDVNVSPRESPGTGLSGVHPIHSWNHNQLQNPNAAKETSSQPASHCTTCSPTISRAEFLEQLDSQFKADPTVRPCLCFHPKIFGRRCRQFAVST